MKNSYRYSLFSEGDADGSFQVKKNKEQDSYLLTKTEKDVKDFRNYSLAEHNTFGISAKCSRFIEFANAHEAKEAVKTLGDADMPLLLIGGGSNLLLTRDFNGTVLHSAIKGISATFIEGGVLVRCGSGEIWDDVVAHCVEHGWYGMENLSLIPGEVGASAVQNIGAYGAEVKDILYKVEAIEIATGKSCFFTKDECEYAYRDSRFKREWKDKYVITHVTYMLSTVFNPHVDYGNIRAELDRQGIEHPTAKQLRQAIISIRNAKLPDPKVEGNAGSFFKNPVVDTEKFNELLAEYPDMPYYAVDNGHEKIPAGWMIEQCGWKGKTLGNAGVHSKQALVLVNKGGATGMDIVNLCNRIHNDVAGKFGIEIHPEVNII